MDLGNAARTDELDWQFAPGKPPITEVPEFDSMGEACEWLGAIRPKLIDVLHTHGAAYLRGLPMSEAEHFAKVREVLIPTTTPYREKRRAASPYPRRWTRPMSSSLPVPPASRKAWWRPIRVSRL